jgi:hypothetical protein
MAPTHQDNAQISTPGNKNHELGTGSLLVHKRIMSAVKRDGFVTDRMPCIRLRGLWYHISVLNVHAQTDKIYDVKNVFYEELQRRLDKFP